MSGHRSVLQSLWDYLVGTDSGTKITYSTLDDEADGQESIEQPTVTYKDLDYVTSVKPGQVHLHGTFRVVNSRFPRRGMRITEAIFSDDTGSVRVVWFRANVAPLIKDNVLYELRGKYELSNRRLQIVQPDFRMLDEGCGPFGNDVKKTETKKTATPQRNIWTEQINGIGLSPDSKWQKLRKKVFQRDNYTCVVCGARTNLTVDHVLELSLGGSNAMSNLQTLCRHCHEDKHYRNFLDRNFDAIDNYGDNYEPTVKIKTLSSALKNDEGVNISYTDRDNVHSYRTIHPKRIYKGYRYKGTIVNKGKVYVDAYCELDKAGRTFRISRMNLVTGKHTPHNTYTGKRSQ